MKFTKFCILIFFAVLFSSFIFGQSDLKTDKYISKTFWLRHNLVLRGEVKVYPNNIEFEEIDGKIVHRGEQVKIQSIETGNDFSKIVFSAEVSTYELLIQSNNKQNFQKSFELAFSKEPIKEDDLYPFCDKNLKTKRDILKCLGFPLRVSTWEDKGNKFEKYYYTCWFLKWWTGFDTFDITIKNGKVFDITGTI